jgi:hypothetical protein
VKHAFGVERLPGDDGGSTKKRIEKELALLDGFVCCSNQNSNLFGLSNKVKDSR